MKRAIIRVLLFAASGLLSYGQESVIRPDTYSLLTMPFNSRQLTLYRGQLQANAGYKFSVLARQFNRDGEIEILRNLGVASVYHYYHAEIRYGITGFLELSAATSYLKRGIRSKTVTYVSENETVKVNSLTEEKGFGDILLLASLRLPTEFKVADFSASGGIYLPSARHEPEQPSHNVSDALSASSYTVNYRYRNKIGYGVPVLLAEGRVKLSLASLSLLAGFQFREPAKEGESIRWSQNIAEDRTFNYFSSSYSYLPDRSYNIDAAVHYQVTGWLNTGINMGYEKNSGGWTEYWGKRYSNPERWMFSVEPGLEIQVSPSVTIYQRAGFPLAGKETYAPFFIYLTLSLNSFPLYR